MGIAGVPARPSLIIGHRLIMGALPSENPEKAAKLFYPARKVVAVGEVVSTGPGRTDHS
jgi:hypothetical protein